MSVRREFTEEKFILEVDREDAEKLLLLTNAVSGIDDLDELYDDLVRELGKHPSEVGSLYVRDSRVLGGIRFKLHGGDH